MPQLFLIQVKGADFKMDVT